MSPSDDTGGEDSLSRLTVLYIVIAFTFTAILGGLYAVHYFFVFDDTALLVTANDWPIAQLLVQQTSGFWRPAGMITHKINLALVGWDNAGFFALFGLAVHLASSLILLVLVQKLGLGKFAAVTSSALFLASPWATEALMWMSSQFDVFAVFFSLLALQSVAISVTASTMRIRWIALAMMAAFAALALLYKENAVVLPILSTLVAIRVSRMKSNRWVMEPTLTVAIITSAITAAYLVIRNYIMDGLNGPYGSAASMWEGRDVRANIWSYVESFASVLYRLPVEMQMLASLFLVFTVISFAAAFRKPPIALTLLFALAITLLPTAWAGVSSATSVASRFSYLPGATWSILIGFGAGVVWSFASDATSDKIRASLQGIWGGITVISLALAMSATIYQSQWWRFAIDSGRLVVNYVAASGVASTPCVYITNLPSATFEGPHVLKTYNLKHYFAAEGLPVPQIRSDEVVISRFDGLVSLPQPEGFSDVCEEATEISLTLPLEQLRP